MIPKNKRYLSGFSLVEILFSMSIMTVVLAMVMTFYVETTTIGFVAEEKNDINSDIRELTNDLAENARQANYIRMYPSFADEDRNTSEDKLEAGSTGDFIVLGFQDENDYATPVFAPRPTNRMIGYYRSPADPSDPSSEGPVMKFDVSFDTSVIDLSDPPTPEELIPAYSTRTSHEEIVELSEGLANEQLFYHFGNETIMINAKIIHGNEAKYVTDTYNITISTRN